MSAADRERIEGIQQRVENATMGPWKDCAELDTDVPFVYSLAPECAGERLFDAEFGTPSDAEFVAHARQDVPWLLSQLSARSEALTACQQEQETALAEQTRALLSGTVKGFAAGEAKAQEAAFKAGYHCQWHCDQGAYGFDPAMSPGDPDGAYTAWRASKETK